MKLKYWVISNAQHRAVAIQEILLSLDPEDKHMWL